MQQLRQQAARHDHAAGVGIATELTAQLQTSGETCKEALATLQQPDLVRSLAFSPAGCRTLQLALDIVDRSSAAQIAAGLRGLVRDAIESPHANYVVQKIITVLAPQEVPFIIEELWQAASCLARHEYGCRVFCRLLEHAAADEHTIPLIDSILSETCALLTHTYGHHVVECALEHGLAHQRSQIIAALRKGGLCNAQVRMVAYVFEKALLYGSLVERQAVVSDFLAASQREMASLAQSQHGCMVLRALLRLPSSIAQQVQHKLGSPHVMAQLKVTKHGRRVLHECGLDGIVNDAREAHQSDVLS